MILCSGEQEGMAGCSEAAAHAVVPSRIGWDLLDLEGRVVAFILSEEVPLFAYRGGYASVAEFVGGYTVCVAKRGYTRETIRGGASEWDVSRPFSSYVRLLAALLVHPVRFFELLPKVPDVRAPALFLIFGGVPAAVLWFFVGGTYAALAALVLPLPLSLALAGLYHLMALGGRYGYLVTWRVVAYPLGFYLPLSAVPGLRWVSALLVGAALLPLGLARAQEIPTSQAVAISVLAAASVILAEIHLS